MASTEHLNYPLQHAGLLGRLGVLAYSLVSYAVGVAALLWLIVSLTGFYSFSVEPLGALPFGEALALNIGLLALFGLQHSVMARQGFKRRLNQGLPPAMERSTYVLMAGVFLGLLVWLWQPMPDVVWQVEHGFGTIALWSLFVFGWVYLLAATYVTDHYDLFGLRQAWFYFRGRKYTPVPFVRRWMYRYSRHPMMMGILIGLWATPHMRLDHLVLAGGLSLYILVGVAFEERDLLTHFGEDYRRYRRRVGALVPWRAAHLGHWAADD